MEKILELKKALEAIGVECKLDTQSCAYCIDNKVHYGIVLYTDIPTEEDNLELCFHPTTYQLLTSWLQAPLKK